MKLFLSHSFLTITIVAAASIFASCNSSSDTAKDDKAQYSPQINKVEIITLQSGNFAKQLISNGKLTASKRAKLYFQTNGVISTINATNGVKIERGKTIASLQDSELALNVKSASLALKRAELELSDFLAGLGYVIGDTTSIEADVLAVAKMRSGYSEALNNLEKAHIALSGAKIVAPFSGKVAELKTKTHERTGSDPFCTLIDDTTLDVDFTVMENEYSFLSKGLTVKVAPFADITKTIEGTITSINPMVDEKGQITVRAKIKNDGSLIDGMNVKVFVDRNIPNQLVVPKRAVVVRDYLDVLFTYGEDNKAHWTYVKILHSNSDSHAVTANTDRGAELKAGDKVIVSGNLNLADGSLVEVDK